MALPVSFFSSWKKDLPASIVVLLVALPLCLGIALGSGAPLFSGIIAGILGGVVVGLLSKSNLSVTGPAAGLTVIVSGAITQLQVYEAFLMAVVIAGALQVLFGIVRAGVIGDYVPNSVIKGMLAAIGLILILKQLPFLVGYEADYEGDERFLQNDHQNTFSEIGQLIGNITPTALVMGLTGIGLMVIWESRPVKKIKFLQAIPAPLLSVLLAATVNEMLLKNYPELSLQQKHMVTLPVAKDLHEFAGFFTWPNFNHIYNINVWTAGFTIAVVASLETLLSIEAVDKLDPLKRITPTNHELKAQGIGNMVSGLLGGLPMTSVVVRSSANLSAGAVTRLSTVLHGFFLFLCVLFIPGLLNKIPLCSLAAILIFTGYKLAKVSLFRSFYLNGWSQFIPFVVTIIAILFTDLLTGICIGMLVGIFFMIKSNFKSAVFIVNDKNNYLIRLRKDVSFLNKPLIKTKLSSVPPGAYLLIDATRADFIDMDIIEEINNFISNASQYHIRVDMKKNENNPLHDSLMPGNETAAGEEQRL